MKRLAWLCMVALAVCAAAVGQETAPKAKSAEPIAELAWLVGGVWTADASKMGNGMQRIETRYDWSDNHAFVRFNTHFVMEKGTLRNYDGQFFWDSQGATLRMWYMNAHDEITQGTITVNGDVFDFAFKGTNFEGKPADLKVLLTRKSKDRYVWELQEKTAEGWKPMAALEYVRTA